MARGGRYLIVGLWSAPGTTMLEPRKINNDNVRIIGSALSRPRHIFKTIQLAQRYHAQLPLTEVVSHRFGLEDAQSAIEAVGRMSRSRRSSSRNGGMMARRALRQLLTGPGPLIVPGAYDALSALLVQQAGFKAAFMSGYAVSAALLGKPDIGLLTGSEMVDNARRMAAAVQIPLIVDGDTGYGNAINVMRTVETYEQAGVSAIQLEDQVTPKRCGHMSGKQVIDCAEMLGKIRAAVDAREDSDLMIIGRTDAASIEGTDAAIARAQAYADAGADILFVEAPDDVREIEKIASSLAPLAPLVFKVPEGRQSPPLAFDDLADLGFSILLLPIGTLLAATAAMQRSLRELSTDGSPVEAETSPPTFEGFNDLVGLPAMRELENRYADSHER